MIYNTIIYEEEIDLFENEVALEKALLYSNTIIDSLYFEAVDETDKSKKFKLFIGKVIDSFKAFITKCINYLKATIHKITGRINDVFIEYQLKNILKNFDKSVVNAEKNGMKTFKSVDVGALYKCINDEYDEYTKIVTRFAKSYIKHASPKDAEKVVAQFNELTEKYNSKLKEIFNNRKEYSIREAKRIISLVEKSKNDRDGGFTDIVHKYSDTCKDIEDLTIGVLTSLDAYSNDTGYIQNAKTLQQIMHNSCIRLQVHSAECVTQILHYVIPVICKIDELANTKFKDTGDVDDDGLKIYNRSDQSSSKHKTVRNTISTVSKYSGALSNIALKSIRKASRKNDIKDWVFTKGESPLTFDNHKNAE